jgi:hypothetical protein
MRYYEVSRNQINIRHELALVQVIYGPEPGALNVTSE